MNTELENEYKDLIARYTKCVEHAITHLELPAPVIQDAAHFLLCGHHLEDPPPEFSKAFSELSRVATQILSSYIPPKPYNIDTRDYLRRVEAYERRYGLPHEP